MAVGDEHVTLGTVSGVHGVRGWIKIVSFTEPRANITTYRTWRIPSAAADEPMVFRLEASRTSGRQVLAKLAGIDDRDRAAELIGRDIRVLRSELPACAPGEYYWADLEGLRVVNQRGQALGTVSHLIDTGAHAVLVLAGDARQMIPFVEPEVVVSVDLADGVITVDWEESYWD